MFKYFYVHTCFSDLPRGIKLKNMCKNYAHAILA